LSELQCDWLSRSIHPANPADAQFAENVLWRQQDVVFVTLNVPGGSNDDTAPWSGIFARPADQALEVADREDANLRWLKKAFDVAQRSLEREARVKGSRRRTADGRTSQEIHMRLFTSVKHPVLAGVASLLFAGNALAHAHLVKSDPAADAQVAAPKSIALTFSEALAPAFSGIQVSKADGSKVEVSSSFPTDKKSMVATPVKPLAAAVYTVTWQAASGDGHKTEGKFSFTVK
jgi:methionine-rich copper-binding protein CopC